MRPRIGRDSEASKSRRALWRCGVSTSEPGYCRRRANPRAGRHRGEGGVGAALEPDALLNSRIANMVCLVMKPQDIVVLLELSVAEGELTYTRLAQAVGMSVSEVHSVIRRSAKAGLLNPETRRPIRRALLEFLIHGLKYVFPAERGGLTRGLPTAHAAPPLKERIVGGDGMPPVWPDPLGEVRGEALSPLYKSVPAAARRDPALYELLALVDAVRAGRARERAMAAEELERRLS